MPRFKVNDWLDENFDPDAHLRATAGHGPGHSLQRGLNRPRVARATVHMLLDEMLAHPSHPEQAMGRGDVPAVGTDGPALQPEASGAFRPTFSSSRHERQWILTYLGPFHDQGQIDDVLRKVKGGKEANVYCCTGGPKSGPGLIAAKIYRPRQFRNLRNDAEYRQGREILSVRGQAVRDHRALAAVRQGTRVGKEIEHTSWLAHEYQTLSVLHAAGVHVPRPLAQGQNTILMEYVGEAERAAPALTEVDLTVREARSLFPRLVADVALMLDYGRVHADLSAYNVLYLGDDFRIIDFPQAVDPMIHPDAYPLFERDVTRVCQYFAHYGVHRDPAALAGKLWRDHGPGEMAGSMATRAKELLASLDDF